VLEFIPQLNFNQKALYKGKINPLSFGEIRERLAVLDFSLNSFVIEIM
jgi:hypothetical protein